MNLRKSLHDHSKKVHTKKSSRDPSRDLSILVLIRTIRRLTKEKPPIPPLASPSPGAIPSMSLQFQPILPAQQAKSYGSGSSKKLLPLGYANVAMYQHSQIQFPQPMQQVTGRTVVGIHSMPQGPPIPHDFQQNLSMSNNHMPGSGGPNLPLSSSYNVRP
ncbi:hypothetical protein CQW23_18518 [Capsicum baccatum]|uniref:Uncharacterized protein n=1 Tax=Capsicum baccatum TaxID=33114 RepID=A0A2G2W360_CAPBA|nr:hypothetical protein CQW23_18518 [Capsicum baccatum]